MYTKPRKGNCTPMPTRSQIKAKPASIKVIHSRILPKSYTLLDP